MKRSTLLLLAVLTLVSLGISVAQVSNLTVNGSTTNFTMTSGDAIDWSYDLPVGATADARIYIDVNENHAIDEGTDKPLFIFSQTDGSSEGDGPPDLDGLENGSIHFAQPVGLAPATYVMEFTNNSVGQTIWGVVTPLASPTFTLSGTVTGPSGVDLAYIIVDAQVEGEGDGDRPFWNGLTDSLGGYVIEIHSDTSGESYRVRIDEPPYPYTISPQETTLTLTGDVTGIDFTLVGSAAQVLGTLRTDAGDSVGFASVYISREDSGSGPGAFHNAQTNSTGQFWFGIPLSELNGNAWRIVQSSNNDPITTYILARGMLPAITNGDSIVHDLVAYSVNSSIDGFVEVDGNPPGFPILLYAANADSGESYVWADSATGSFSIPVSDQVYDYSLWPNNLFGGYQWSFQVAHPGDAGVVFNITTTGVDDPAGTLPEGYSLAQNYPNPFNPTTTITYGVPARSQVLLTVYDVLGREVATLVNGIQEPGPKSVSFDAASLPSGVYTYRIVSGTFTDSRKMLVIK